MILIIDFRTFANACFHITVKRKNISHLYFGFYIFQVSFHFFILTFSSLYLNPSLISSCHPIKKLRTLQFQFYFFEAILDE